MTWGDAFQMVNYLDVLVAVVLGGVVGMLWYGMRGFGARWAKLVGLKQKDLEKQEGVALQYVIMFVFYFIAALLIASLLELTAFSGGGDGALLGGLIGFAAFFGPLLSTYGFARRKFELALIDGGYVMVVFALFGAVIGAGVF